MSAQLSNESSQAGPRWAGFGCLGPAYRARPASPLRSWPVLGRSKKNIVFLEALPAAPLSFSIVLQFPPALDNLELIF